jgi:hypothetical protein
MEAKFIYKNVAWKIHGDHAHGTKCVLIQKWNVKLKPKKGFTTIL